MALDHQPVVEFISELHFSKPISIDAHFAVYEKYVRRLGYDGATYTFVPQIQIEVMKELPVIFLSTEFYPMGFINQYTQERLDQNDFTVRKIAEGHMAPMDWREHELNDWISRKEAAVIRLARDSYGIKNAISIPMMHEEKGGAGASVISYKEDAPYRLLKAATLDVLVSITRLFHERAINQEDLTHKFILPVLESLTSTEISILRYKASGKRMKNIEHHVSISHSFATNVLSDLRKRLGGVSTDRLMYLLGLLNTFSTIQKK